MGVQARDHATDGIADQLLFVDHLDVVRLDHSENGGQLLELLQGQLGRRVAGRGLELQGGHAARQGANGHPASDLQFGGHRVRLGVLSVACQTCSTTMVCAV